MFDYGKENFMTLTQNKPLSTPTVVLSLIGGIENFENSVRTWLLKNDLENMTIGGTFFGPNAHNEVFIESSYGVLASLINLLKKGDEPFGLYQAIIPSESNAHVSEILDGKEFKKMDAQKRNLAKADVPMATRPSQLAEKGW
jgi:hypothetical protein